MKRMHLLLALVTAIWLFAAGCDAAPFLAGSATGPTDPQSGLILGSTASPTIAPQEQNAYFTVGDTVTVKVLPGDTVEFTIHSAEFLSTLDGTGIDLEDEMRIFDVPLSRCLDENNQLKEGAWVVMLDVTATAIESSEAFSENEHMLNFRLVVDQDITNCYAFWYDFEETEDIHRSELITGFNHYWLPAGESVDMKIALPVPVGCYPDSPIYLLLDPCESGGADQLVVLNEGNDEEG